MATKPLPPVFDIDQSVETLSELGARIDQAIVRMEEHSAIELTDVDKEEIRHGFNYLFQYSGSKDTQASYRKILEKLFQYRLVFTGVQPLRRFKADRIHEFTEFSKQPTPLHHWVSLKNNPRFLQENDRKVPNPDWRPFSTQRMSIKDYHLSNASLTQQFACLSSFYSFLIDNEAAGANPVRALRQKAKYKTAQSQREIRRLSDEQMATVIMILKEKAAQEPDYERSLWTVTLILECYLRVSEVVKYEKVGTSMGQIRRSSDNVWWIKICGKRSKFRDIPMSDAAIEAMIRYRRHLGAEDYPVPGDTTPLIANSRNPSLPVKSARTIQNIVKESFQLAVAHLRESNQIEDATELDAATTHWLRHTGISIDVKTRPMEHVRDDAGHDTSQTTDLYIDDTRIERGRSRQSKTTTV